MDTLPSELLRHICDYFKDKKSTLKAVRLVNKNFAGAAAPLLFQTLLLYQTTNSWEKLRSIAGCEWLAAYVVKLEIAALDRLPHYLNFVDWKQSTWNSRWNDCYDQKNRAGMVSMLMEKLETQVPRHLSNPHPYKSFEDWKHSPEVRSWNGQSDHGNAADKVSGPSEDLESPISGLDSALGLESRYERYRYWHDGENEISEFLSHSQGPQPPLDLIPFPKLRTMAILGSRELWKGKAWPPAGVNRKVRETTVLTPRETRIEKMQRNALLSLTLQMLDASGVNITRLEFHRYREILMDYTFLVPPLKHLQELILEFPYRANYGELYDNFEPWKLAPWLRGADDLRTLIILPQDPHEYIPRRIFDVIALFHGTAWPKLRSIYFKATFVRPKSLLRFLSEHSQSLESIRIEQPFSPKRTWQSLDSKFLALEFRSPNCVIDMDISLEEYQLEELEDDRNWIDADCWP